MYASYIKDQCIIIVRSKYSTMQSTQNELQNNFMANQTTEDTMNITINAVKTDFVLIKNIFYNKNNIKKKQ